MTALFPGGWAKKVDIEAFVALISPGWTQLWTVAMDGFAQDPALSGPTSSLPSAETFPHRPLPSLPCLCIPAFMDSNFLLLYPCSVLPLQTCDHVGRVFVDLKTLRTKGPLTCLFTPSESRCCLVHRGCAVTFLSPSLHLSTLFSSDSARSQEDPG